MHHRRRSLTRPLAALALSVAVLLGVAACSGDDPKLADDTTTTRAPSGTIVPGGDTGSSVDGTGTVTGTSGDPSEGLPVDQFCRAFAGVRGSEQAMDDAIKAKDIGAFQTAYNNATDSYLAMAENPPDEVADAVKTVALKYDELTQKVSEATTIGDIQAVAVEFASGPAASALEDLRDFGAASC